MLRTNKQPKLYNNRGGNYSIPANNRSIPKASIKPTRHWTCGRVVYWIVMALMTKRIIDNVIFLVTLPPAAKPVSAPISSPSFRNTPPSDTKSSFISNPAAANTPKEIAAKPKPDTRVEASNTQRDLKKQDKKKSHDDDDDDDKDDKGDDDDGDEEEKKETPAPTPVPFDPTKWKVVFEAPKNEATERKICFTTCSYGKAANEMDPLVVIENQNPKYVRFFLFSNLNDDEWHTPGWTKIVTHYNYTRVITHSRYGKFMGWKYPEIRDNCEAVFYMDSVIRPSGNKTYWDAIANYMMNDNYDQVMANKNSYTAEEIRNTITNNATNKGNLTKYLLNATGFMQHTHPRNRTGIYNEIQAIQWAKKDFKKNVKALMNWFRKQPEGFDHFTPVYLCQTFGYNPHSKVFQLIAESFWEHYSLEIDSWRDQPLWSFMLRRYLVRPTIFPYPQALLWEELQMDAFGHGNHEYISEADVKMGGGK